MLLDQSLQAHLPARVGAFNSVFPLLALPCVPKSHRKWPQHGWLHPSSVPEIWPPCFFLALSQS